VLSNITAAHTANFNANGGTGTMAAQVAGSSTSLSANSLSNPGYTFAGWSTSPGGSVDYADTATYSFAADITLYAQWSANPTHTVTYANGGGTGTAPTQAAVSEGANFTVAANDVTGADYNFGGWNDSSNMPPVQAAKINSIRSAFQGPCEDKHELLSQYKFTIAYENTAYPGYVTEKMIDAIVSASIPVYLGAPDITEQVPASAFVDARAFSSPEAIANHIEQITESDSVVMIAAGQKFLQSPQGQRYSYEGFANWVVSLASGKAISK